MPGTISFITGHQIDASLIGPLNFEGNFPKGPIPHYISAVSIPLFSKHFISTLAKAGIDNLQTFQTTIENPENKSVWENYFAVNIIGVVRAADLESSKYDVLMPGDNNVPPLMAFSDLVVNAEQLGDLQIFRLAESPSTLLITDAVMKVLDDNTPKGGWGFDATEINIVK